MKKLLASVAALASLSGTAVAADLPSRKEPVSVPPPSALWNGVYVGLNAGGTWDTVAATSITSAPFVINGGANAPWALTSALAGPASFSTGNGGFIGGGQIGANFQYGSLLLGIETDIQGVASGNNAVSSATVAPTPLSSAGLYFLTTTTSSKSLDYLGTFRGRNRLSLDAEPARLRIRRTGLWGSRFLDELWPNHPQ